MCISILHAPGDDPMGYETSAERWSPVQSVEKILLSVVSMLAGRDWFVNQLFVTRKISKVLKEIALYGVQGNVNEIFSRSSACLWVRIGLGEEEV